MFIDTLMALWNIICRGRIRKMVATSIGISIGLICLLAFIGLPAFSRSSDLMPNITTSSEVDQNNTNDVILTSPHTRAEVTPPGVPPTTPMPLSTPTNDQVNQRIPGPPQFTLPVPPPLLPPFFIYPQPRIHHIHITIHRMPAQNDTIPPTPPADLTPPSFPPTPPADLTPPSFPPTPPADLTPPSFPPTVPAATMVPTATPLPTPQATSTTAPVVPAPIATPATPLPSPMITATCVPVSPGPMPSITIAPRQ